MKKLMLLSATSILMLSVFSCKKSNNTPSNSASVMVVNGCAGTSGINATAAAASINNSTNLQFLKNSGYQYVSAGSGVNISFILNGVGTPLSNGNVDLTTNAHYSVFAGGLITNPAFVYSTDDLTVTAGMAKVRFVNLSPDNLTEKCYVGTQLLQSGVTYKTVTPFSAISPVSGTSLQFQDVTTSPATVTSLASVSFSAGKIYTVLLTGTGSGTGASALTATIISNN